jgi:hypothetical protein
VVSRWGSLVIVASVAACVVLLIAFVFRKSIPQLLNLPLWIVVVVVACIMTVAITHGWGRLSALFGIRHSLTYPPLWFAGALGAGLVLSLPALVWSIRKSLMLESIAQPIALVGAAYVASGASFLLVAAALRARFQRRAVGPLPGKRHTALETFDDLRQWLNADRPVAGEADDAFALSAMAERVARRLLVPSPAAQAVVGAFGSGKSSVLSLVDEKLNRRPGAAKVRLVPVAVWPFETARAAVEGIIQKLIDKVGAEVDVVALRGVPESYAEAMSAAISWVGALARLQGARSPNETLEAIDKVAVATGLQFVVWIEDLERFAGRPEDSDEKLNPIRALLLGLDQLTAVTVVTATTSLRLRFDLEKIARFVEEIPRLPERDVARLLGVFRQGCRTLGDYIDPAGAAVRERLDDLTREERRAADFFGIFMHGIVDSLPELCATPRTLKQALRACLDAWESLLGEIDLDDLLVISVLREGQPEAFALLQSELVYWRGLGPREEKESREVRAAWDTALMNAVPEERTRKAVQLAVSFVFEPDDDKPQGLRQHAHTDYWLRYMTRESPRASERDQPVLEALTLGDDAQIAGLLAQPGTSGAVEDFSSMLDLARVIRLLDVVVEQAIHVNPAAWQEGNPPGLIPLWRIWLRRVRSRKFSEGDAFDAVKRAYDATMPVNPAMAARIEQYFASVDGTVPTVIGRENRKPGREHLRRALRVAYVGNPRALADNLAGAAPPILLWLTWGLDEVRAGQLTGVPFEGWTELAPTVLEATELAPQTMLPQLACLVVRRANEFRSKVTYGFDQELATTLFGDSERVLAPFRRADPSKWAGEEHVLAVFRATGQLPSDSDGAEEDDD